MVILSRLRHILGSAGVALAICYAAAAGLTGSPALDTEAWAQTQGNVPGRALGNTSDSELWGKIRRGAAGYVPVPDRMGGVLVQSQGEVWRLARNGPVSSFGGWLLLAVIVVLVAFFAIRGRVRVDAGPAGRTVERFNAVERFAHWLTAGSFIVLGLTGLNLLYGRDIIKPLIGADAFATLTIAGKYAHNYIAFAFMAGLVLILVLWLRQNLPNKHDLIWIAKGGGLLIKGVHPPAKKFNAGQKVIFWLVILVGASVSYTGLSLMFPFTFEPFTPTFAALNAVGFDLPTELTTLQEMQLTQVWHTIASLLLIAVIIAHIYIGTLGMVGAFEAMSSGQVDENWARQHHALWLAEAEGAESTASADRQPAE